VDVIDRTSPVPLWAQLLSVLRERIASGTYNEAFPTDAQLEVEFSLSRHTTREAVRRLQDEGIIQRRRGVGTFVMPAAADRPYGTIYSLYRAIEAQGREQRSDVLDLSLVTDAEVAERLGVDASTALVRLERLRRVDGAPLAHDTAWLPADIARALLDVDFSRTALYDELARTCGVHPDAGSECVRPVLPDERDRILLQLDPDVATYRIERHAFAGDVPIEWRETLVRADRFALVAQWSPGSRHEPALAATAS
jgi:GntR family transcriptional regulator